MIASALPSHVLAPPAYYTLSDQPSNPVAPPTAAYGQALRCQNVHTPGQGAVASRENSVSRFAFAR